MNYYNENDHKAAAWLRELIKGGHIADGVVDERSIIEVKGTDLAEYRQCHFFAGIGGWSYALRLAGWPDDEPVWTGSCPCQPFSQAGKGDGARDARHLWPAFNGLIGECLPDIVFGEQVARAVNFQWLDGISADLEASGYAVGAAVLGAHSVGAPHRRQRLYWVANSIHTRSQVRQQRALGSRDLREQWKRRQTTGQDYSETPWGETVWELGHDGARRRVKRGVCVMANGFSESLACVLSRQGVVWKEISTYATARQTNPYEILRMVREAIQQGKGWEEPKTGVRVEFHAPPILLDLLLGAEAARYRTSDKRCGKKEGSEIIGRAMRSLRGDSRTLCASPGRESKEQRNSESPETMHLLPFVLARHAEAYREEVLTAHASLNRCDLIRGYGNAIVPRVASEFIQASVEAIREVIP